MFSLTSTWDAVAANGSSNALQSSIRTISAKETSSFKFDADSMVDFESCAQLTKPSNCHKKCNLTISSKHVPLSRIIVVSESKRAEICDGNTKEYKFTKPGELLDDSDPDMIMFKNDIVLEKPYTTSIEINLTGIEETCWLLGVFVFMLEAESVPPNLNGFLGIGQQKRFDLEQMNSLLKETELSGKAQSFKDLFETFQRTGPLTASNDVFNLGQFNVGSVSPSLISDISSTLSAVSSDTKLSITNDHALNRKPSSTDKCNLEKEQYFATNSFKDLNSGDCVCNYKCCEKQTTIFKEALEQIETNVLEKIAKLEKKQDDKFNQILELLSKSTS